jgi:cardiolipin synthase
MNELANAVASLAKDLHPDVALSIVRDLVKQPHGDAISVLKQHLGNTGKKRLVMLSEIVAKSNHVTARDIAFMMNGAVAACSQSNQHTSELVWTGPSTGIVPIRKTEQVLIELIEHSRHDLFIVSYVAYKATSILEALKSAAKRGVRVSMLMELPKSKGGAITFDSIAKVQDAVPAAEIYVWDENANAQDAVGSMHAKCAVADGKYAFITSANLTGAAMERNMELGVSFAMGSIPSQLQLHLEALVKTRQIVRHEP